MSRGHRLGRPEHARVGDRDRDPGEVVDRQPVRAHLAHEVLVGVKKPRELERVGRLHARYVKGTSSRRGARRSMAMPSPTWLVADHPGRAGAVDLGHERRIHLRDRLPRAFTTAQAMRWVKLTLPPVVRPRWSLITTRLTSRSLAGTGRTLVAVGHGQAGAHVLDDPGRRAPKGRRLLRRRERRARTFRRRAAPFGRPVAAWAGPSVTVELGARLVDGDPCRPGRGLHAVVGEELPPAFAHRTRDLRDRTRTSPRRATHWSRKRPRAPRRSIAPPSPRCYRRGDHLASHMRERPSPRPCPTPRR